jgi:hypothetical protein
MYARHEREAAPTRGSYILGVISVTIACLAGSGIALAQNIPTNGAYSQLAAASDPPEGPWAHVGRNQLGDYGDELSAAGDIGPSAFFPASLADAGCNGFVSQRDQDPERVLERLIVDWTTHHLPYVWHMVGRVVAPVVGHIIAGDADPDRMVFKPFGITEFSIRKRRVSLERKIGDALTVTLSLREEHHRFEYDRNDRGERFQVVSLVFAHRFR